MHLNEDMFEASSAAAVCKYAGTPRSNRSLMARTPTKCINALLPTDHPCIGVRLRSVQRKKEKLKVVVVPCTSGKELILKTTIFMREIRKTTGIARDCKNPPVFARIRSDVH
jgi:hypothetical protein